MNCKQGDLAILVKSTAGNEGKIVRCLAPIGRQEWTFPDGVREADGWRIDPPVRTWTGFLTNKILDEFLRPIGNPGDDAKDETLEWLPAPTQQTVY